MDMRIDALNSELYDDFLRWKERRYNSRIKKKHKQNADGLTFEQKLKNENLKCKTIYERR